MSEAVNTPVVTIMPHPEEESREKILKSIANTRYLNVWEGAVRSGKTATALIAFAMYVVRSPAKIFLLSGRTLSTVENNCILDDYGLLNLIPGAEYKQIGQSKAVVFTVRYHPGKRGTVRKIIRVFGASDIRAYMAIRGNTYAGWFADEINMHDKEFVVEALKRTAMSLDRKHFWTLNPDNPRHWVYTDYLDRYDAMTREELKALGGYRWWHFVPADNPAMTPAMLASLELQYPRDSYLYDRYILGLRCVAEGLIYPKVTASFFRDFDTKEVDVRYCAIDFGADHPTVMVFGGIFKGNRFDWRLCAEYYDKGSDKTTYDHYAGFLDMCRRLDVDPARIIIAIDPAAKTLRMEFEKHKLKVVKAKNDVLPGIDFVRACVYDGVLSFHSSMTNTLTEFGTYSWDPKAAERGEEKPIKLNDDCMDAVRYFAYTHMRPVVGYKVKKVER